MIPDEPVFRDPLEAQAFAMTVLLHERGLFTWPEWTAALAAHPHWLAALESLVSAKGASSPEELARYRRAWQNAAHRTPHGQSIELQSRDLET